MKEKQCSKKLFFKTLAALIVILSVLTIFMNNDIEAKASLPSTVGTTNYRDYWPAYSQRTFHANGRFWVFWFNGSLSGGYEVYSSSVDGETWTNANPVNDKWTTSPRTYSLWFDGVYVHNMMVYENQWNDAVMVYSRGVPNDNGTITWMPEQNVLSAVDEVLYDYVQISVDSNGCPWIAYETYNYTDGSSYPYVITSSTNDGVWNTRMGFPYQLAYINTSGVGETAYGQGIYPLTNGKMVAFYGLSNVGYAQAWDDSEWSPQASINGTLGGEHGGDWEWSAISSGDILNIACVDPDLGAIDFFTYDCVANTFSPVTSTSVSPNDGTGITAFSNICISIDPQTNNIYIFYENYLGGDNMISTSINYINRTNNVWSSSPTTLVNDTIASALSISVSNTAQDGFISIMYNKNLQNIYKVAFINLDLNSFPDTKPTGTSVISPDELLNWLDITNANCLWIVLLIAIVVVAILGSKKSKSIKNQSK